MQFQVMCAHSLDEVWEIMDEHPDVYLVAGGTDIIPRVNQKIESHPMYIWLGQIPGMKGIEVKDNRYVIGALTTLSELAESHMVTGAKALIEAATKVASPQIRNQGTIGGNLLQENRCMYFNQSVSWRRQECCFKLGGDRCYQYKGSNVCVALLQSDTAPALMALGGKVVLESPHGQREVPIDELYLEMGKDNKAVSKDEVLTRILVPDLKDIRSAYVRETIRGSIDFPLISCAAAFRMDGDTIAEANIVIGSAGVHPVHAVESEKILCSKRLDEVESVLQTVVEKAKVKIMPFKDSRVDGPSRKIMGGDVIGIAILQLL